MGIVYTTKAKEDLVNLDWRVREKIIDRLRNLQKEHNPRILLKMHDSEYYKLNYFNHIIIGKYIDDTFNVITVLEQKKIKFPE